MARGTARRLTLALGATLTLAASGCGGAADRAPALGDLAAGPLGPSPTPATSSMCEFPATETVLRDDEAWRAAWATMFACVSEPPPPPSIDFAREMVLLVAVGARGSSGFSVAITSAVRDGAGTWQVEATEYRPARGCVIAAVVTWPVAFARIPRSDAPAVFHQHVDEYACQ